jgi:hypothetical protein
MTDANQNDSGGDTSPNPAADGKPAGPITETACLQLGWSMQRLYRARLRRESADGKLPDRLPGLKRLTSASRAELDLKRAQTCLSGVAKARAWETARTPTLDVIEERLVAFKPTADPTPTDDVEGMIESFRKAVLDSHIELLTAMTGAGASYGKAYNLGRALADTCRPNQEPDDLRGSFDPYRLKQLQQWLDDLATVLPSHAAKAVVRSLSWWRDTVYLRDDTDEGKRRRQLVGSMRTDAPQLRHKVRFNPKVGSTSPSGDMSALLPALERQGDLWRVVLTAEKNPLDLLTPDDYLVAAKRAVAGGKKLALRSLAAAPLTALVTLLFFTGFLAAVLWIVYNSDAAGGGKLAGYLVAIGGYLGSLGRVAMPRLKSAGVAVEQPLWQAALDYVAAEAVSLPPVGLPDPSGWSGLISLATDPVTGARNQPDGKATTLTSDAGNSEFSH